ncbi:MAG: PTS sugar transporter subunit IIA [bacterium]|nr:PTS sugar transporter subunit IIA [bacterium]
MQLASLTRPALIFPQLPSSDRSSLLRALAERIVERGLVDDADKLYEKLWEREQLGSTGIGSGVAIPHCKMSGLDRVVLAIGLLPKAIDFGAVDELPVRLLFLVISPNDSPAAHLQCLAAISKWVKAEQHVRDILDLDDPQAIYQLLLKEGT